MNQNTQCHDDRVKVQDFFYKIRYNESILNILCEVFSMPYVVKPINRNQVTMSTLNSMVECDSIARVIDCFVDHIDLNELGFEKN